MSRRIFYTDTETTGLSSSEDQVLEWAAIVDDEHGNPIEEVEELVKLKHGVNPNPTAVSTHGINALSESHSKKAITEAQMVKNLMSLAKKHTIDGRKPVVCAQNARFDRSFYSIAFKRQGEDFDSYFSKSEIDSIKVFEKAINSGELVTKQGRFGMSKSLESVAEALDIKYEGGGSHRALSDTKVMREAVKRVFPKVSNGVELHQISCDSSEFKKGEVRKIVSVSQTGTKTRHVYILGNDISEQKIFALDEYDVRESRGLSESSVREFNYSTIVAESDVDKESENSLRSLYEKSKDEINQILQIKLDGRSLDNQANDLDKVDFKTIEMVRNRMHSAKNKKAEYEALSHSLVKSEGIAKSLVKTVFVKAERLQASLGFKTWSEEIEGKRNLSIKRVSKNGESIEVGCHPSGNYYLLMHYGDGKMLKEIFGSKAKLKSAILSKTSIQAEAEELIKSLPAQSAFEDKKHPISLAQEIQLAMDKARGNPEKIEALMTLIEFYKEQYPETYKGLGDPSKATRIDHGYYKYDDESEGEQLVFPGIVEVTSSSEDSSAPKCEESQETADASSQMSLDDHTPKGQLKSSVKCSMCMRPISKEISLAMGMGPTCRAVAKRIDSSQLDPERFVDLFVKYNRDSSLKIKKGASLVLKIRTEDGGSKSFFADSIRFTLDSEIIFVDRRRFNHLVSHGEEIEVAEYLSTVRMKESDVDSFGKVSSKNIDLKKSA